MNKLILSFCFIILLTGDAFSQVLVPIVKRYEVNQRGSLVMLSNSMITCNGGSGCSTGQNEVPPGGTHIDNDFNSAYIDIDGDGTTFSSSNATLNLPACSKVTFAGLYWGAPVENFNSKFNQRNKIKIKQPGASSYTQLTADTFYTFNINYQAYNCYKNITSIVDAAGNGAYTLADLVSETGDQNQWAGWSIVIVYSNDGQPDKNFTVFDGVVNIDNSNDVTITTSGFYTPPSGAVNFELGEIAYDGDRGNNGDSLLFKGAAAFVKVTDALHPADDVFNSTIANNGVQILTRNPAYKNTLGFDANIFVPNNATKNYLTNGASSAQIKVTSAGDQIFLQVITAAINTYEPKMSTIKSVSDINGGIVNAGDTLLYTIAITNNGNDDGVTSYIVDTIPFNGDYVPGTTNITVGPNSGLKTDAAGDDQANYSTSGGYGIIRVNLGVGANSSSGGTIPQNGVNKSTSVTFKVKITDDCVKLMCNPTISNRASVNYTGVVSGIPRMIFSNPSLFDPFGCPVQGYTSTSVTVPVSCTLPPDTSIGGCLPLKFDSIPGMRPGYSYYTSSWVSVIRANTAGTYYGIRTITGSSCKDTIRYTVSALTATISNAGPDQNLCNVTTTNLAGNTPTVGGGKWRLISGPNTPTITTNTSPTSSVTGMIAGTYVFRWSISLSCDSSVDDVSINIYAPSSASNAGPDQNLCNVTSTTLAGNTPAAGTGNWTRISGPNVPTITTPSSPTSTITGMITGTYVFRWTITNGVCASTTDDVQIIIYALPTASNAGPDQNLCNVTGATLAGNNPEVGTGAWSVISGPNAPTITTPSSPTSTITGMIPGIYTLRWSISNGVCAASTDDVQISIYALPTVSNAGIDQSLCNVTSTLLSGNSPVSGTGSWTLISGPNSPTINTPGSSNTNINGMIAGVYVFRWTISNGACTSSTDDVQVTIYGNPTAANAGSDQSLCNANSATMSGNTPAIGSGTWTFVSGPNAPSITTPANPSTTITGMITGLYIFRWTISNGVCSSSADDVNILITDPLTVSNAGPDQVLCNVNAAALAANTPVIGTGIWTLVSGPNSPNITTLSDPLSTVTGMIPGVYTFRWIITNGICIASTDEVVITNYADPTTSNAGADQSLCNVASTVLAGNSPTIGVGTWTFISGPNSPTITAPNGASTSVTGMIAGVYIFRWTIVNGTCPASTDDVQITIYATPTTSNAGPDQSLCNVNNATFAGNNPAIGSGNWTLVSGPNSPTITTPSSPVSTITGMIAGVYVFRWTISSGPCTVSTDDVQISIFALPTVSNAGPDQNLCNVNNTTLAGNNAVTGTGTWTLISGPNSPTITAPTNPASTITGMVTGVYVFRWTISNGSCASSTDDVQITNYAIPDAPNAGPNQNLCNAASAALAGNNPVVGSGNWTLVSGPNVPTITTPSSSASTVTGMIPGVYVFRWTIGNGVCASSSDDVQVTNYALSTVSNAGADQNLCNVNSITFAGNNPVNGSGTWTLISGPNIPVITTPSSSVSTVTGMITGVYIFRWTITNGVCASSSDDVQITNSPLPSASAAGPDQNLCNVNNTTLAGNNPAVGSGSWTLVSGPNTPTITAPANPASTVTGMIAGVYVFRWTISNGTCAATNDQVQITIYDLPTVSNAGPDQNLCNVNNATLAGNAPTAGSGTWTLVSGPNTPTITTISNPASTVTGMISGVYTFRWTISNGVCASSADNIKITIYSLPTVSNAGPDQDLCSVTSITFAGNTPTVGTGMWTTTSGPNVPVITNPASPTSTVTGMIDGVYVFEWTISNGVCAPSVNDLTVTIYNAPTVVDAGPDQDLCDIDSATMAGNVPGVGTGTWTFISGPNTPTIALPNDPNSVINGMVTGTYQFGWTIGNGVCFTPTDTVQVIIYDQPTVSIAGSDVDLCSVTSTNLSGNIPTVGTGLWTNISGPNVPTITAPDSASTTVTGMIPGVYVFRWTISNGPCVPSDDDIQVTIFNTPVIVDAGPDQELCDSTTAIMAGNVPGVGTGDWTIINGPNVPAITDVNDPATTITGMVPGTYLIGWTITNGVCTTPTDTMVVTIYDLPTGADAGSDQKLCNVASTIMAGNTALIGNGVWKNINGPNVPVITDSLSETTTVTGMIPGTYLFSWTISNGVCDPTIDTVAVDIYALPTIANAGGDQNVCVTDSTILNGNVPAVGSGTWTLVSGPNVPVFTDTTDAATTVKNLIPGVYLLAWTIDNSICAESSDTVQITHYAAPTGSNAGPDQNLCNVTVTTLAGNIPAVGSGTWSFISGPNAPVIAVPSNNATTVSGLIAGVYEFAWTISNGSCTASIDTVSITIYNLPTTSDAGPDQHICDVPAITLAGNNPASGTGTWTLISGPNVPVITNAALFNSGVTGMIPGTYWFMWTINNGACAVSSDSVLVDIYLFPPFVDAGPDQDLCNVTNISLSGNAPTNGTGTWLLISGPNSPSIMAPNSPTTVVTGMIEGTYSFSWGIVNGTCSSYKDTMQVIIHDLPSIATAGVDQQLCNANSTTLNGNFPSTGNGAWRFISGPNTPAIVDTTLANTAVNTMIPGVYLFSWNVKNGICSTSSDTVQVTIYSIPLSANAGPDQHLCNANNVLMAGNDPMAGTGTWTYVSGPNTPVITAPNDSATTITGMTQGTYVFGWQITNGVCSTATDFVTVIIDNLPTPAFAGADQNLCDDTTFILIGNTPANGIGTWSFFSGPNIPIINSPNSVSVFVENLIPGVYVFVWSISNGICAVSSDTVQISSFNLPDVADADAGPDQDICNVNSVTINSNLPVYGTGTWTFVSGPNVPVITNPLADSTTVTGMIPGTYLFQWSISNGICPPSLDTVQIIIYALPTVSDAGVNQVLCTAGTAVMAANNPIDGIGTWTFVSGPNIPVIDSVNSPNSNISGMVGGQYTFNWEISNGNCSSSNDTMTILMETTPTVADAGVDQILCNTPLNPTSTVLSGNSPAIGTGNWTLVSGPNVPTISSPGSPATNISGLINGVYILRWTISNSVCIPSFDDVSIVVHTMPINSIAGADQELCNAASAAMAADSVSGTGTWAFISGPNVPVITSVNDPYSTVTGLIPGTYLFQWTLNNSICSSLPDTVQILNDNLSTISNAGSDQVVCNDSTAALSGNVPVFGSGVWSMSSGNTIAVISDTLDPAAIVSNLAIPGVYVFNWTITNGVCAGSIDSVLITINELPTHPDAGPDQTFCGDTSIILSGNIPATGTGVWSVISGPNVPVIACNTCANSIISNLITGVYILEWTITNGACPPESDTIQITRIDPPTISIAGSDQTICVSDTIWLTANVPTVGIGLWTYVSGPTVPTIQYVDSAHTAVTSIISGTYIFRWTISNGMCSNSSNDVQIDVDELPTTPDAGLDVTLCGDTSHFLAGNNPGIGAGIWTTVSGPGPLVYTCIACPDSLISGIQTGVYTLRWTITNGVCAALSDDVDITRIDSPSVASAGPDQTVCISDTTWLSANTPSYGTGLWTLVSGPGAPTIIDVDSANTAVVNLSAGTYIFKWSISNGMCAPSEDSVQINVDDLPTPPNAGPDQTLCGDTSLVLSGNAPAVGLGTWTIISGPNVPTFSCDTCANSSFDGLITGVYTLRWTIDNGVCTPVSDDVELTVIDIPTPANAGPDQTVCISDTTWLAANPPLYGAGLWTLISGPGSPTIIDVDSANTAVVNLSVGTYLFKWTISNGMCTSSEDTVQISIDALPTPPNAGPDQTLCGDTSLILSGNAPVIGLGTWTIISGPNVPTFTCDTCSNSGFNGMITGVYTLRWTIDNGVCTPLSDDVVITIIDIPTVSNAGPDQTVCISDTTWMAANTPVFGSGLWTLLSGPGSPSILNTASPNSGVVNLSAGTYIFKWTISNGICTPSEDSVQITVIGLPTPSNAGSDVTLCGDTSLILSGNLPVNGTGTWTIISGPNVPTFSCDTCANSSFNGMITGVYTLRWTIDNGTCAAVSDDVDITIIDIPTVSNAGPDQTNCISDTTWLAANAPVFGTGVWTLVSGPGSPSINNPSSPNSAVTNLSAGTYIFKWTISNGMCTPSEDSVLITVIGLPTPSNAGSDVTLCGDTSIVLSGNVPANGTGTWTIFSGPNAPTFSCDTCANSSFNGMITGVYTLRWTIDNGTCAAVSDYVDITVIDIPTVSNAGPDQTNCISDTTWLAANMPVFGTGAWTQVSGPGSPTIINASSPNTAVTNLSAGTYIFTWTISNGMCTPSEDSVQIAVIGLPTLPNAGLDQTLCGDTSYILGGNVPSNGTGTWTIISGPNAPTFSCDTCANSSFNGMITGVYTLRWTIDNGTCAAVTDDVDITVIDIPTVSNAGPDQAVCTADTTRLSANTPLFGIGFWTLVSGPGSPVIIDTDSANTIVTNLLPGTYVFKWTISNGMCTPSEDSVQITILDIITLPNAGADQTLCGDTLVTLTGSAANNSIGTWTEISGPNTPVINCPSCASTTASVLITGVYRFQWTVSNGVCPSMSDDVDITRIDDPGTADAGTDQSICFGNDITLSGNSPLFGTGIWNIISGPGNALITMPSSAQTIVTNLDAGTHLFEWLLTNQTCAKADTIEVIVNPTPAITVNSTIINICPGEIATLNASGAANYVWTPASYLSNPNISNPTTSPDSTITYTVYATSQFGCVDSASITVDVCDIIDIPNGFSPDGDGVNDKWVIINLDRFPGSSLQVFNRWGNIIYKHDDYDNSFDGKPNIQSLSFGGGKVPAGTYFYVFKYGNSETIKSGYVIIRY